MVLEVRVLKIGGRMERGFNIYAFASAEVVEVGKIEAWETAFEESVTESDLALYELGVTTKSESLSMSVLLLTGHACCRAGGALWVL